MTMIDPATAADITDLMRLERGHGFERLVGRWSDAEHAAEMTKAGSHYLVARASAGDPEGFVLLQGLDDPPGCATLRRIAVARPGGGLGALLVEAALDHAFGATACHRLQLRVYPENTRARRAYARAGFVEEGLLREVSRQPDGGYRSMVMMSVLRSEWEVRRPIVSRTVPPGTAPGR